MHKITNGSHAGHQHFSVKNGLSLCRYGNWQASTLHQRHPHFSRKNIQRASRTFGGDSHMFRECQFPSQCRQEWILQQGTQISRLCFNPRRISANAKVHQSNPGLLGSHEYQRCETFSRSLQLYNKPHSRPSSTDGTHHKLTKKDVKFAWEKEQETAFKLIKEKVAEAIMLMYPDPAKTFHIYPDTSSKFVMGSVLVQDGKVISTFSRKFNDA